jgi:pimeloyl-ACP methyl ester carboxylesterase
MGFVEIDGLRIHYQGVGELTPARGQRVLYVHGTGCNTKVWQPHMAAVAAAHIPVAIDLPGHGQSAGNGFRGVADYSHFVVELAAHLGWKRFVVAGHSMGGAIALTIALYHAELLNGLMLIDTGARLRVHPAILQAARQAAVTGRRLPPERSWGYASSTPQSVVDAVYAITADTDPRVTYKDWICDDSFDVMSRVPTITVPTLAVCGEEDQLTPVRYHRFFQEKIPNCQLAVIPHAGHWSYIEQPEAFNRVVSAFLASLPAL